MKKTVTLLIVSALIAVAGCQVDPGVAIDGFTAEFVRSSLNGTKLGEVELSWNEPTNNRVYSYAIYHKSSTTTSERQLVNSVSASSGSYVHDPAEIAQDDTYSYRLVALSVMGDEVERSDWTNVSVKADQHPRKPFVETENYRGRYAISVTWDLWDHDDLTALRLYRAVGSGDYVLDGDVRTAADNQHKDDDGITEGQTYRYYIDAHYKDGEVVRSNVVEQTFEYVESTWEPTTIEPATLNDVTLTNNAEAGGGYLGVTLDYTNPNNPQFALDAVMIFRQSGEEVDRFRHQALNAVETELDSALIDDGTYDIEVYLESTYGDQVERSDSKHFNGFDVDLN